MTKSHAMLAAVAAIGLMGLSASANAAPAAGALAGAGEALRIEAPSATENVRWACWWHRGYRTCGHVVPRVYGFYAGPPRRHYWGWRRWH